MDQSAAKYQLIRHLLLSDAKIIITNYLAEIVATYCTCVGVQNMVNMNSLIGIPQIRNKLNKCGCCFKCSFSVPFIINEFIIAFKFNRCHRKWEFVNKSECICQYLPPKMLNDYKTYYERSLVMDDDPLCSACYELSEMGWAFNS